MPTHPEDPPKESTRTAGAEEGKVKKEKEEKDVKE